MRELQRRGIGSVLEQGAGDVPASQLPAARAALDGMVELLCAFNRATTNEQVPMAVRALFPAVLSYCFTEDDLLPSRGSQLVLGLLDDAFIVHRAAVEVAGPLGVDLETTRKHLAFLEQVLPADVRRRLDALVVDTLTSTTSHAEQLGL